MSLNLFTNIESFIPKTIKKIKDIGIYSNFLYSDLNYGLYNYSYDILNYTEEINLFSNILNYNKVNNISFFSNISNLNYNELDLYSNIKIDNKNEISFFSLVSNYEIAISIYSRVGEDLNNKLDLYTNIESKSFCLDLYSDIKTSNFNILNIYSNIYSNKKSFLNLYSFVNDADFIIKCFDKDTNIILTNVNWILYKRNSEISPFSEVNVNHTSIASGITLNGIIKIYLDNYNLQDIKNDFYLKIWKDINIEHSIEIQINYNPLDYINLRKRPYLLLKAFLKNTNLIPQPSPIDKLSLSVGGGGTTQEIYVTSKLISNYDINNLCFIDEKIKVFSYLLDIIKTKDIIYISDENIIVKSNFLED